MEAQTDWQEGAISSLWPGDPGGSLHKEHNFSWEPTQPQRWLISQMVSVPGERVPTPPSRSHSARNLRLNKPQPGMCQVCCTQSCLISKQTNPLMAPPLPLVLCLALQPCATKRMLRRQSLEVWLNGPEFKRCCLEIIATCGNPGEWPS